MVKIILRLRPKVNFQLWIPFWKILPLPSKKMWARYPLKYRSVICSPVLFVSVLYLQVSLVLTDEPARSRHAKDLDESAGTSTS